MKKTRYIKIIGIIMLAYSIIIPGLLADGWHPSEEYLHLYEPAQKAVIYWGEDTQILYLSSAAKSDNITNLAWVVPIISTTQPIITAGNMSIFEKLVDYFKPKYYYQSYDVTLSNGKTHRNVTIIEVKEIDIYDIIVVQATNASDLLEWLKENNLQIPDNAEEVINHYINQNNCYFVVNKIDLKNRFKDVIEQLENGTRHENYSEYQRVLEDLRIGMSTPLKFEFKPPVPYYPLIISSLNEGYSKIDVYVISEEPMADKNMILKFDQCKLISDEFKENLSEYIPTDNAKYVTRLYYNGRLTDLSDDAVFNCFSKFRPKTSAFLFASGSYHNLSEESEFKIMTFDQNSGILQLNYRIDNEGPWMVAEKIKNPDKMYFDFALYMDTDTGFLKSYKILSASNYAEWKIVIDPTDMDNGIHKVEFQIIEKDGNIISISEPLTQLFFVNNSADQQNTENEETNQASNSFALSGLIMLSMFAIAVISRKTSFKK